MKNKTEYIHIRVTAQEKKQIQTAARANGLDDMTAYLLQLHRKNAGRKNIVQKPSLPLDNEKSEL